VPSLTGPGFLRTGSTTKGGRIDLAVLIQQSPEPPTGLRGQSRVGLRRRAGHGLRGDRSLHETSSTSTTGPGGASTMSTAGRREAVFRQRRVGLIMAGAGVGPRRPRGTPGVAPSWPDGASAHLVANRPAPPPVGASMGSPAHRSRSPANRQCSHRGSAASVISVCERPHVPVDGSVCCWYQG